MSEQIPNTPPAVDTGTTPPTETPPPSNLPSDNQDGPSENILAPEGQKFGGKFESTQAMLDHIKTMEDKYANAQRELATKTTTPETPPVDAPPAADASTEQMVQQRTVIDNELMPEFMKNGMIVTDEMVAKAEAVGIDARDLKLNAYEIKENLQKSFAITGGQEQYSAMIEWGKANLTEAQKIEFDKGLNSSMSEYAVKGLWQDFQAAGGSTIVNNDSRISGTPSSKGLQPYADRRELYKDKDYIESAAGRNDHAARKRYRDRLRITPDTVLGIS